ncbi:hypothetical protein Celaphus_00016903 [Cervus elaphus hippelaphus]|uniref:Uncharacterized protein n=1 Tax=Cervus elaphus hippelaphus TaxID=46360 RepID=A0A212CML2_CEREH|nr:hypothetical protein Celaphus_00016903 [Cervus elaphus hippelaphus]
MGTLGPIGYPGPKGMKTAVPQLRMSQTWFWTSGHCKCSAEHHQGTERQASELDIPEWDGCAGERVSLELEACQDPVGSWAPRYQLGFCGGSGDRAPGRFIPRFCLPGRLWLQKEQASPQRGIKPPDKASNGHLA